ncbi:MAG TPA: hypothetical protein VIY48_19290 [Candidatus Paceibacterota bacterium]
MAITFDDIVTRVKQQLLGYTKDQASVSYLAQAMTATDTTFLIDPETATNLSRGLVEVEDEMILVKKFDRGSGTVTVLGGINGRGAEGTIPTTHAVNAIVTDDPRFPVKRVREAIADTVRAVYPDIWVFGEFEFPWVAARYEYPIPAEAEDVYKVVANTIGPSGVWFPLTSWRFNAMAPTGTQVKPTPTPTGKSIQVMRDFIVPGRNVRVSYIKKPGEMVLGSDPYAATTGFDERTVDMIVYGACWRLLPAYEAARLQQQAIEATERAPLVPAGAASAASKFFYSLYSKRLDEERTRLQRLFDSYQNFNS